MLLRPLLAPASRTSVRLLPSLSSRTSTATHAPIFWPSHTPPKRKMSASPPSSTPQITVSKGSDPETVTAAAHTLTTKPTLPWRLLNASALERDFHFRTFAAAWRFMSRVADECRKQKHHPEWTNIYSKVRVRWTTHSPPGLGERDVRMCEFCDSAGREEGEVEVKDEVREDGGEGGKVEGTEGLQAGDCCTKGPGK